MLLVCRLPSVLLGISSGPMTGFYNSPGVAGWMKAELVEAGDQSPFISRSYTGKRFRMLPNEWTKAWAEAASPPPRRRLSRCW